MSASRKGSTNGNKRNLPIWMISRSDGSKFLVDEQADNNSSESSRRGGMHTMARRYDEKAKSTTKETGSEVETVSSGQTTRDFSKLLEGVVLVLSGIVNPERRNLRSQALEMGAEYQPDWNSNCTLLVCAFPNTPKFQQVEAECGTIVSKEWITECYTQKNLVDIDSYLMHPGKPWRKSCFSHAYNNVITGFDSQRDPLLGSSETHSCYGRTACASDEVPQSRKFQKPEEAQKCQQPEFSAQSKASRFESSRSVEQKLSLSELKNWAADDLKKTIKWLKCQDAKPEPSEFWKVAAGGVLTCLQDAIELLEQKQGNSVQQLRENWNFLPRVVEELIKMEDSAVPNDIVHKQALSFKEIYEEELSCVHDNLTPGKGKPETRKHGNDNKGGGKELAKDYADYDSEETIEMTEEEIDLAFESIASKKPM